MAKAASRNASSKPVAAAKQAAQAPAKTPAKPASAKPVAAKTANKATSKASKPSPAKKAAAKPAQADKAPATKTPATKAAMVAPSQAVKTERGVPLIEMRDISIAFGGIKAVDHATVDLFPGEVVGLLGHNGAGKSTLIKVLSGAYARDNGQIFINGKEVRIEN
ncbi:MAG TPA: ATP-binding cassette domain-containing protein, partial [Rhizobiaceae bacterium]|nr:ATP-binding cassette domain-containing protein [Rhizobiaceae bacterium]